MRVCVLRGEIGIGAGDASEGQKESCDPTENSLRVRNTTANTKVGRVQGGSDGVREMRG